MALCKVNVCISKLFIYCNTSSSCVHVKSGVNIYLCMCASPCVSCMCLSVCVISNQGTSQNHVVCVKPAVTQSAFTCLKSTIYLLKVNNRNTRTRCEICSKLTIKTPKRRQWRRSGVFIVNFEHISHLVLKSLLLTLNMYMLTGKFDTFLYIVHSQVLLVLKYQGLA